MDGSKEQGLPHNRMIHIWTHRLTQYTQGPHQLVDMDFYPNQELTCNWHTLAKEKSVFSTAVSLCTGLQDQFWGMAANTQVTQGTLVAFRSFALFGLFLSYWSFVVYFGFQFCFVGVSLSFFFFGLLVLLGFVCFLSNRERRSGAGWEVAKNWRLWHKNIIKWTE